MINENLKIFNGDLRKKAHEITWDEIQNHLDITI